MGVLCENIGRRANREDDCKGHFWESRYRCRECSDVAALLICGIYVDLNPIKSGEAAGPETACYTSIYSRLKARRQRQNASDRLDGWMAELTLRAERKNEQQMAYRSRTGRRASDLGILPISLEAYLQLLKWTQRTLASGARTTIPQNLAAVLERLAINHEAWLDTIEHYETAFGHVVGSPTSLAAAAERMEVSCLKGATASRRIFT